MATYVVQAGDYAGKIAQKLTGSAARWTELCAANPQLAKHPTAGCVIVAGKTINLPSSWSVASTSTSIEMPLLPDGRPVAELVPYPSSSSTSSTSAKTTPTVVTIPSTSTVVPAAATVPAVIEEATSTGVSPLLKWGLIGGSVIIVGGVTAWLLLRSGSSGEPRSNSFGEWIKHKIGLKDEKAPRSNRRRRRRRSTRTEEE